MPHLDPALQRQIDACNNIILPGDRLRFHVGGEAVGWIAPDAAAMIGTDIPAAGLDAASRRLVQAGHGWWRDEAFDVRTGDGRVIATVDRGVLPILGIEAEGIHLNALVRRADGLHIWVGRRAADKKLDPGKLDHLVAGGISAGMTAQETLVKEGAEEAGLPEALAAQAVPVSTVRYVMMRTEGLRRDRLHCFDLYVPDSFQPVAVDGEVAGFELWPIARALQTVRETDDFKFNVNLVLIDLFVRLGLAQGTTGSD